MIQNLIFKIYFLKKVFRACNFYIFPHVSVDIIRVFFNFIFFSRESQSQQELPKKATHFTIQFLWKTSLIIWTSTHLTLKIICCCNTAKNLSEFTKKFPASMSLFGVKKNICTPPFLDAQNYILEALWKQMSVYFCISP